MYKVVITDANGELKGSTERVTLAEIREWVEDERSKGRIDETDAVSEMDITDELDRERAAQEARVFLTETDWYIIREMDSGVPCPEDIKLARQAAREKI